MTLEPYQLYTRIGMAQIFAEGAPTNALARVLRDGECEMLGGFSYVPPSNKPGWICRVSTPNGADRLLAIIVNETTRAHGVIEIETVPWEHWIGGYSSGGWSPHSGDQPVRNAEAHRTAVALYEAQSVVLRGSPEPTTDGTPTSSGVAEAQASSPHFWDRAVNWLRRNK